MQRRSLIRYAVGTLAASGIGLPTLAQAYPQDRPIQLIVPIAPGGASDFLGRFLAERVGPLLGQTIVVVNRPGAGGTIGSKLAADAAPDGHTLLLSTIGFHAVAPALYKNLPYDQERAFAPVIQTIANQQILVTRSELPVRNLADAVAMAKANPAMLTYGSAGNGTVLHLGMEYLKFTAGIDLRHIPYNGSVRMVTGLLSQEIDMAMPDGPSSLPAIRDGRLRAIAVTGRKRTMVLPDTPTIAEAGYPGFDVSGWSGIMAPAGTPAPIIAKLNAAFARVLRTPETIEALSKQDFQVVAGTPEAFGEHLRKEQAKWAEVVKRSGAEIS